ncbi:oxygenase MpaB family protein [Massilia brevitalea]|uniref:oxygenase MpaB family protein n=1 Tax=Massilia brevitalea TaxID=442526 RepID=UPI002738DEE3|nr:oxygenase MpaB family protein [Massilia brevitalea]
MMGVLLDPALAPAADPRYRADPLADDVVNRILADCDGEERYDAIAIVNRELAAWTGNGVLDGWRASPATPLRIAAALEDYLRAASALPAWADPARIGAAEAVFVEMSMLSCTLLFCASLPECYVPVDLASVLHTAGQLEQHTDYRVRSTAAMIFPVMLRGGLTAPSGGGVAQVLKVRLIHATIRHLILRGNPATVMAGGEPGATLAERAPEGPGLHRALYARGWDVAQHGLPINQEELAYTLLTFHYVFLRSLRRLGLGLTPAEEGAYLHGWNVVGHLLGIEPALLVDDMAAAEQLFARLQARGRQAANAGALPYGAADPRPALAAALMGAMQDEIPLRPLKPFPTLLTRYLCGRTNARELGLDGQVSLFSRTLFVLCMGAVRGIDWLVRRVVPGFSISRLVSRVLGYRLTVKLLMDQTRPLKLPEALLNGIAETVQAWHHDPKAPAWMNRIELRLRPDTSIASRKQP